MSLMQMVKGGNVLEDVKGVKGVKVATIIS